MNYCIDHIDMTYRDFFDSIINGAVFKAYKNYNVVTHANALGFFCLILLVIVLLVSIAYFTLAERKIMASMQRRRGPNVVGFWGLLQPLADGLKLLITEIILPSRAKIFLFILSPVYMFFMSLLLWVVIPWTRYVIFFDYTYSLLYVIAISSLNVFGIIIAGWSSNSKYAFLGGIRSTAQLISYEISLTLIYLFFILITNSFCLQQIVVFQEFYNIWFIIPLLPLSILFFCSMLAETNRAPFDLPEAEAELVSGYNTEYSSIVFALFFLAEYSNMLFMSSLFSTLFLGGWSFFNLGDYPFILPLKTVIVAFVFIWIRATLPRYRYDQLMFIGWKIFLPFLLGYFFLFLFWMYSFDYIFLSTAPLFDW